MIERRLFRQQYSRLESITNRRRTYNHLVSSPEALPLSYRSFVGLRPLQKLIFEAEKWKVWLAISTFCRPVKPAPVYCTRI